MAILIKRYANRKLYNTETSRYITLKGIAQLLEEGEEVQVIDKETGEDITQVALSQILVDNQRAKEDPSDTLLTQILSRGGDALYSALKRSVGDATGGIGDFQDRLRQLVGQAEPAHFGDREPEAGERRSPFARRAADATTSGDETEPGESAARSWRRLGGLQDLLDAIQSAVEKAFDNSFDEALGRGLDLREIGRFPRKRDFDALNENLVRVAAAIERLEARLATAESPTSQRSSATPRRASPEGEPAPARSGTSPPRDAANAPGAVSSGSASPRPGLDGTPGEARPED